MQQTISIDDELLNTASQCLAIDDINEIVNTALFELIKNHPQKEFNPKRFFAVSQIEAERQARLEKSQFICQEGVATHKSTGLMWLRFALGQKWQNNTVVGEANTFTWQQAMAIAQQFNDQGGYGGFSDWRLPTIDELKTLLDKINGQLGNYIDAEVFPKNGNVFWSSSPNAKYSGYAWIVNFSAGGGYHDGKNNNYFVRLVRGGQ